MAATPTYVGAGTVATTGVDDGTFTPGLPSGLLEDDILILAIEIRNEDTVPQPTGWTFFTGQGIGSTTTGTRCAAFWRRYTSGVTAPTCTLQAPGTGASCHAIGRIIAVRGCITTGSPLDAWLSGFEDVSDTSISITSLTTNVDNTLVVGCVGVSADGATNTTMFSGWTNSNLVDVQERTDNRTSLGDGGALGIYTGEMVTAGATGATTATAAAAGRKGFVHFSLKPPLDPDPIHSVGILTGYGNG